MSSPSLLEINAHGLLIVSTNLTFENAGNDEVDGSNNRLSFLLSVEDASSQDSCFDDVALFRKEEALLLPPKQSISFPTSMMITKTILVPLCLPTFHESNGNDAHHHYYEAQTRSLLVTLWQGNQTAFFLDFGDQFSGLSMPLTRRLVTLPKMITTKTSTSLHEFDHHSRNHLLSPIATLQLDAVVSIPPLLGGKQDHRWLPSMDPAITIAPSTHTSRPSSSAWFFLSIWDVLAIVLPSLWYSRRHRPRPENNQRNDGPRIQTDNNGAEIDGAEIDQDEPNAHHEQEEESLKSSASRSDHAADDGDDSYSSMGQQERVHRVHPPQHDDGELEQSSHDGDDEHAPSPSCGSDDESEQSSHGDDGLIAQNDSNQNGSDEHPPDDDDDESEQSGHVDDVGSVARNDPNSNVGGNAASKRHVRFDMDRESENGRPSISIALNNQAAMIPTAQAKLNSGNSRQILEDGPSGHRAQAKQDSGNIRPIPDDGPSVNGNLLSNDLSSKQGAIIPFQNATANSKQYSIRPMPEDDSGVLVQNLVEVPVPAETANVAVLCLPSVSEIVQEAQDGILGLPDASEPVQQQHEEFEAEEFEQETTTTTTTTTTKTTKTRTRRTAAASIFDISSLEYPAHMMLPAAEQATTAPQTLLLPGPPLRNEDPATRPLLQLLPPPPGAKENSHQENYLSNATSERDSVNGNEIDRHSDDHESGLANVAMQDDKKEAESKEPYNSVLQNVTDSTTSTAEEAQACSKETFVTVKDGVSMVDHPEPLIPSKKRTVEEISRSDAMQPEESVETNAKVEGGQDPMGGMIREEQQPPAKQQQPESSSLDGSTSSRQFEDAGGSFNKGVDIMEQDDLSESKVPEASNETLERSIEPVEASTTCIDDEIEKASVATDPNGTANNDVQHSPPFDTWETDLVTSANSHLNNNETGEADDLSQQSSVQVLDMPFSPDGDETMQEDGILGLGQATGPSQQDPVPSQEVVSAVSKKVGTDTELIHEPIVEPKTANDSASSPRHSKEDANRSTQATVQNDNDESYVSTLPPDSDYNSIADVAWHSRRQRREEQSRASDISVLTSPETKVNDDNSPNRATDTSLEKNQETIESTPATSTKSKGNRPKMDKLLSRKRYRESEPSSPEITIIENLSSLPKKPRPFRHSNIVPDWVPSNGLQNASSQFANEDFSWEKKKSTKSTPSVARKSVPKGGERRNSNFKQPSARSRRKSHGGSVTSCSGSVHQK